MEKKKTYRGMYYIDIEDVKRRSKVRPVKPTVLKARNMLRILERDGFKCVRCGSKKYLTIDHIKPFKHMSRKRSVNQYSSKFKCQTLCINCHKDKNLWTEYDREYRDYI